MKRCFNVGRTQLFLFKMVFVSNFPHKKPVKSNYSHCCTSFIIKEEKLKSVCPRSMKPHNWELGQSKVRVERKKRRKRESWIECHSRGFSYSLSCFTASLLIQISILHQRTQGRKIKAQVYLEIIFTSQGTQASLYFIAFPKLSF